MKIKAVIFDMDGLLLDTENLYITESQKVAKTLGYHIPHEIYVACIGANHKRIREILKENLGEDFPVDTWEQNVHRQVLSRLESEGPAKKLGVDTILKTLGEKQVPLAVASSSARKNVEHFLLSCGIRGAFEHLVCGDEVTKSKPNPEIFLQAAGMLGVPAESCMVFEDSFAGIQAAHNAGMRPVMVPDLKVPDDEIRKLCFKIFTSLEEAEEALDLLLS